jgi:aminobenzoyl-glutamate utilization protein B
LSADDKPSVEMNKEKMEKFAPQLKKYYYDPGRYKTYLEQLGIQYPTVRTQP